MHRDIVLWRAVRRRVLIDKVSKRQVLKEVGLGWHTLQKMLNHSAPPPHTRKGRFTNPDAASRQSHHRWADVLETLTHATPNEFCETVSALAKLTPRQLTNSRLRSIRRILNERNIGSDIQNRDSDQAKKEQWMLRVIQAAEPLDKIQQKVGDIADLPRLIEMARNGKLHDRNRAMAILAHHHGYSSSATAGFLQISRSCVQRFIQSFRRGGMAGLFPKRKERSRKADDPTLQKAVFSVLHSPPSEHGINRTTWKLADLQRVVKETHCFVVKDVIREIIRKAGYRWKRARNVLTSPDPKYREKLERIRTILSQLKPSERFFSIDEFGPCGVKMKGGRRLCGPSEQPVVPQLQKSKGWFVLVGALELSQNQMTHFFSKRKNTTEILRLLAILLEKYRGCSKLYPSWDAASWHASKKLQAQVSRMNDRQYRTEHGTPEIELVPLPVSAQYLNVIESVFSGMAKAIIHNSDYESLSDAMAAIDRYFADRNEHFRQHPKRAGKKIWGQEIVPALFDESQNCKDPRWR